jgi:hypothetical protein
MLKVSADVSAGSSSDINRGTAAQTLPTSSLAATASASRHAASLGDFGLSSSSDC